MKVIIPLAGFGKRMRPQTWSKPKPLLNVAGKAILGHVLDKFAALDVEEVVFIVGWLGDQIKEYVDEFYDLNAHYVVQDELKGQAHALYLAKEHLSGPCVIAFVDTLFEADLSSLQGTDVDGTIFVQRVTDPRRFGVVVEQYGRITRLIEKPEGFEHRKAMIGLYYVGEGKDLINAIEYLMAQNIQTKGEFYLADALQIMIDRGARFISQQVSVWEDCGKPETLLHTNRYLLAHGYAKETPVTNSTLIPPVYIADTAQIEASVIGPHVTICDGVHVKGCIIQDSIIEAGTTIEHMAIRGSLIGRNVSLQGKLARLNIGDNDIIDLSDEIPQHAREG